MGERPWNFRCFVDGHGNCKFEDAYREASAGVRAGLDNRLEYLRQQPAHDWGPPHSKMLKGACRGLIEIRFLADKVQQRPLGFFGPRPKEFTFLFWATEKGGKFIPRNACKTANQNRDDVESDEKSDKRGKYSHACEF